MIITLFYHYCQSNDIIINIKYRLSYSQEYSIMTQSLTPQINPEISNRKPSPDDFEKPAIPDLTNVIIDDGEPVDNLISEKQQRLLVSSLYSSFNVDQPFLATANVSCCATRLYNRELSN